MKWQLALWFWTKRRHLVSAVFALFALPVGFVTVLAGAFTTTPLVPDEQLPRYMEAAEGLPVEGVPWEALVAVDAIRFRQDFSKVTRQSIAETAWLFIACRTDEYREELEHRLPSAGMSVAHPLRIAVPSRISWTLDVFAGAPSVDLLNSSDATLPDATVAPGLYYLRVTALVPSTSFHIAVSVVPLEPVCQGRSLDEVMDRLRFDPAEREIAREMVRAFIEATVADFRPDESRFVWPVPAYRISSGFGPRIHPVVRRPLFHHGIDIPAPVGTPVSAVAAGDVQFAGSIGTYGLTVILDHGTFQTVYSHLDSILVEQGRAVGAGQVIGRVGNTGLSGGPHLHFEWRVDGRPVAPLPYWRGRS